MLSRFDGLTQDEVAARMQISRRMVVKHLARAIAYCEVRVHYARLRRCSSCIGPPPIRPAWTRTTIAIPLLDDRRPSSLPPDPLALHEAAAEWLVRRQDASWSAEDARELDAWLAAGPAHQQAYAQVSRTWQDLARVPRPALASDARGVAPLRAIIASTRRPARLLAEAAGPAGFLQGLCCHLCGSRPEQRLRLVSLGQHPGYTLNVATDAGETRQLDLPDGSHVALNFNSTLQVRYYPRRRELVLNQGEGYFDVAPDARRPSPWMRAKAASPWSARPSTCAMRRMKSSSRSCTAACGCSPTATKPAPS